MFSEILRFLSDVVFGFFCTAFLARFALQAARASSMVWRGPLGRFLIAVTDWAARPLRRVLPSIAGQDTATLVAAWVCQLANLALLAGLVFSPVLSAPSFWVWWPLLAALETFKVAIYLLIGVVLVSALFSWINPHAPAAAAFNALARPWLAPIQRRLPPLGGFDLSPLVLLVIAQVVLIVLERLRIGFLSGAWL